MNDPRPTDETLFAAALERPPAERTAFLDDACAGDAALRARIEALLRAHDDAAQVMATSAFAGTEETRPMFVPAEKPGDVIGRYKLLQKIGEGGCGIVYMAEQQEPVVRRVALKVIKLGMDTREVVARFEAERQALALMDHPNIARVLDGGATGAGRPFFVMELVRGVPITKYCDEQNLATAARLELFTSVCHAVQHAHQKGIIHRDLKPSNILVTLHDGRPVPKVIDFGIAKATQGKLTDATLFTAFEQFIGTPAYMSPEQAELSGLDIDTRSDIYSLGVLLYELLTGRPPFDPKTLLAAGLDEIRRIIREVDPPRPSTRLSTLADADQSTIARQRATAPAHLSTILRGDLDWIVMRCLEKDRLRRYENADHLALDVERHLRDEPVTARPPTLAYRIGKFVRRRKSAIVAAVAVLGAAAGGLAAAQWLDLSPAPRPPPTSECFLFRVAIEPATGRPLGAPVQLTPKSIVRRDPPAISPDGRTIACWYAEHPRAGLAVMDADGRNLRLVFESRGQGRIVWLGPNELLFQEATDNAGEPVALMRLDLASGKSRPFALIDAGRDGFDWQYVAARQEIVYLSREVNAAGRMVKAHVLADRTTRNIVRIPHLTGFRHSFSVSPDARHIAYGIWLDVAGSKLAEMRLMTIDGTPERTLLPAPKEIQQGWRPSGLPYGWSPSGKFLLYDQYPGGIAVLEADTGRTWTVPGAQDQDAHEWGLATWSPTGDFIVINRYRIR
ncbi:MAG: serine/threonine protein kinase [Verrucomicrobia bacterium]|nr:serine/threonine protein kinase [Verrucomicrobiota bacterium]